MGFSAEVWLLKMALILRSLSVPSAAWLTDSPRQHLPVPYFFYITVFPGIKRKRPLPSSNSIVSDKADIYIFLYEAVCKP